MDKDGMTFFLVVLSPVHPSLGQAKISYRLLFTSLLRPGKAEYYSTHLNLIFPVTCMYASGNKHLPNTARLFSMAALLLM